MLKMMRNLLKGFFFMNEKEYEKTISFYASKFNLKEKWVISVVERLPKVKLNCGNPDKALAFTEWSARRVVFKEEIFSKFKMLTRAYIRHELRHCEQMEHINSALSTKYASSSNFYTNMLIALDNKEGYRKSLMEADAWLAFFGVYMNIDKVVKKIIKRNMPFLN